jgi:Tfp pilus assembly protein PilF
MKENRTMKKLMQLIIAAMFVFIVSCSSSDPQTQLKEIDELMNKEFTLNQEETVTVNSFVAEGKKYIEQGKQKEASETLAKAIKVLSMAEDAYIFNKAD